MLPILSVISLDSNSLSIFNEPRLFRQQGILLPNHVVIKSAIRLIRYPVIYPILPFEIMKGHFRYYFSVHIYSPLIEGYNSYSFSCSGIKSLYVCCSLRCSKISAKISVIQANIMPLPCDCISHSANAFFRNCSNFFVLNMIQFLLASSCRSQQILFR